MSEQKPWKPGEPWVSPGVEDVLPLSAVDEPHDHARSMPIIPKHVEHAPQPEPRWHEIATEGLPPEHVDVLTWGPEMHGVIGFGSSEFGEDDRGEAIVEWIDDHGTRADWARLVTHWHPLPEPPAPPTSNDTHCARCGALVYHVEHARQNPLSVTYWLDDRRLCPDCGKPGAPSGATGTSGGKPGAPAGTTGAPSGAQPDIAQVSGQNGKPGAPAPTPSTDQQGTGFGANAGGWNPAWGTPTDSFGSPISVDEYNQRIASRDREMAQFRANNPSGRLPVYGVDVFRNALAPGSFDTEFGNLVTSSTGNSRVYKRNGTSENDGLYYYDPGAGRWNMFSSGQYQAQAPQMDWNYYNPESSEAMARRAGATAGHNYW